MPKFRKKPIVVEAEQWFPGRKVAGVEEHVSEAHGYIGRLIVRPGDWVLTEELGKQYPCPPGIFEVTYEPIEEG